MFKSVHFQNRKCDCIKYLKLGDPDMYDGALFSYQGDFLDYLQLEDMGVFTTYGYDPSVPEEKLEELRRFGESLK